MKRITAILILLTLCMQCFLQLGIVGWYEINVKSITEKYCVNKNKPKLHCNGKCHLKKQLNNADRKQSKELTQQQTEWVAFIFPEGWLPVTVLYSVQEEQHITAQNQYSFLHFYTVFHPPQMV